MCKKRSTMPIIGPQQWKIHKRNDGKEGKKQMCKKTSRLTRKGV
jgi:hypothetical protein